jgi:hypothetical protein
VRDVLQDLHPVLRAQGVPVHVILKLKGRLEQQGEAVGKVSKLLEVQFPVLVLQYFLLRSLDIGGKLWVLFVQLLGERSERRVRIDRFQGLDIGVTLPW